MKKTHGQSKKRQKPPQPIQNGLNPAVARNPDKLFAKALDLQRAGNLKEAESLYKTLLAAYPSDIRLLTCLAIIYVQKGQWRLGAQMLEKVITINPDNVEAYYLRGLALHNLSKYGEALASYDRAIALNPHYAEAYCHRGITLYALKHYDEALGYYEKAIALNPRCVEAWAARGAALYDAQKYDEALANCDTAIALKPDFAEAHYNRGLAFHGLKKHDEALASYASALALKSDYAEAYNNRGFTLGTLLRYDEALAHYGKAIALKPHYAEAYYNRGVALQELHHYQEAMESYDAAIAVAPDYAEAYWNKGLLKLLLGEYEEGWKLYEWRWKKPDHIIAAVSQKPLWSGKESLAGKTILLYAEQGLGDAIQFCRYVPLVEALGASVILGVPSPLATLMSTLKGSFRLLEQGTHSCEHDFHCPLMSLPYALQTTMNTIPADIPYLSASPEKLKTWQERLGAKSQPRIGLLWSGAAGHKNDHNRSIALSTLAPLLYDDFEFHSLQKEIRQADEAVLTESKILSHAEYLKDFSDTAALIAEMDIVISVDTSVAHLAGALGKPVWILLPFAPDFRWLLGREDSPWYPTARLFRQQQPGDWNGVIASVKTQLESYFSSKG